MPVPSKRNRPVRRCTPIWGGLVRGVLASVAGTAAVLAVVAPPAAAATTNRIGTAVRATAPAPVASPLPAVAAGARAGDGAHVPGVGPAAGHATSTGPVPAPAATPYTASPPTPVGLPSSIEGWPVPYEPQTSCDPTAKPGVTDFQNVLTSTYGAQYDGIGRTCYLGSTSEHEEGRALDWGIDARNSTEYAQGMQVVSWLMAKDSAGNPDAMARRLGVMYVIFNARILGFWDTTPTWEPYSCSGTTACHIDHMHFSFTWDGALAATSYWSKKTVTSPDYGPCRVSGLAWAPQRTASNYAGCGAVSGPPIVSNPPSWYADAAHWSGVTVRYGSANAAVSALQPALGLTPSGSFGDGTLAAVELLQRSRGLPVTGVVDAATWRAVLGEATGRTAVPGDFTGDGRADVAVFRPDSGTWNFRGNPTAQYGQSGDIPVPGDYDGNGVDDIALFRPSTHQWAFRGRASVSYGLSGDIPVPGDYAGNGRTDIAVFRPDNAHWYIHGQPTVAYGLPGDIPVAADYDGNGTTDIAVFRPSNGMWYVRGQSSVQYGQSGDIPVPADYDGNGTADIALFRPSTHQWAFQGHVTVSYGLSGDIPQPGDYAGNGRTGIAVFRPANGTWYFHDDPTVQYGQSGDIPLVRVGTDG